MVGHSGDEGGAGLNSGERVVHDMILPRSERTTVLREPKQTHQQHGSSLSVEDKYR